MLFGIGECCAKCITCAEVLKSRAKQVISEFNWKQYFSDLQIPMILYQWNELRSSVSSDVWVAEDKRLDRIVVEKHIPKIFILMSRDPFPENLQCLRQVNLLVGLIDGQHYAYWRQTASGSSWQIFFVFFVQRLFLSDLCTLLYNNFYYLSYNI